MYVEESWPRMELKAARELKIWSGVSEKVSIGKGGRRRTERVRPHMTGYEWLSFWWHDIGHV